MIIRMPSNLSTDSIPITNSIPEAQRILRTWPWRSKRCGRGCKCLDQRNFLTPYTKEDLQCFDPQYSPRTLSLVFLLCWACTHFRAYFSHKETTLMSQQAVVMLLHPL